MSRRNHVPKYRRHKQSGQAIVTLTDDLGRRHDVLLGKYGTRESRAEYARQIAEWEANNHRLPVRSVLVLPADISVNELAVQYMRHASQHYRRPDGTATKELIEMRYALRPVCHLYGHTSAKDFGPLALKAVRKIMVEGYQHPKHGEQPALSRGVVNHRVNRIRRVFKWAVENEMVPPPLLQGLQAVRGLQRGRSPVRETEPVKPVAEEVVLETLPFMPRPVAAMVQLQLLAGMRPGEVVVMRGIDLDTSGQVWLYRPGSDQGPTGQHKTAYQGHHRIIALGPKAQQVIRPFLQLDTQAYLFSPREAMAEFRAQQRRNRKTKVQPSQLNRKKRKPKKAPGVHYTVSSFGRAVAMACDKADCHAHEEAVKAGRPVDTDTRLVPHWHPHQLRHTAATKLRRECGLDVARVVLGHRSPQVTELYAELDITRAAEAMKKLG